MSWHAKASGAYSIDSTEALENAKEAFTLLYNKGWTLNAFCGFWGNVGGESGYNPWRWQGDDLGYYAGTPWTNMGYGLPQFTPASKYINYAGSYSGYGPNFADHVGLATDGEAQVLFIDENADYYSTSDYPISYANYKASTMTPQYLALVWLYNYERPADPSASAATRQSNAYTWYQLLSGYIPGTGGQEFNYLNFIRKRQRINGRWI